MSTTSLLGRSFLFTYPTGLRLIGRYGADSVTWHDLTGPAAGTSRVQRIYSWVVVDGVFFLNWVEESGTTVSQVIDLHTSRVFAFVTLSVGGDDGRAVLAQEGSIAEVSPAEGA